MKYKRNCLIIFTLLLFHTNSFSSTYQDSEWYRSALDYNNYTISIGNLGTSASANTLLINRQKAKERLITSPSPSQHVITEMLNSVKPDENIAALINVILREDYRSAFVDLIADENFARNKNKMIRFYMYSYYDGFNKVILTKHEGDLLEIIDKEKDDNNFIMALPLLFNYDSHKIIPIISRSLLGRSQKIQAIICSYVANERESLLKLLPTCN